MKRLEIQAKIVSQKGEIPQLPLLLINFEIWIICDCGERVPKEKFPISPGKSSLLKCSFCGKEYLVRCEPNHLEIDELPKEVEED